MTLKRTAIKAIIHKKLYDVQLLDCGIKKRFWLLHS